MHFVTPFSPPLIGVEGKAWIELAVKGFQDCDAQQCGMFYSEYLSRAANSDLHRLLIGEKETSPFGLSVVFHKPRKRKIEQVTSDSDGEGEERPIKKPRTKEQPE
jgi:hypothetical protein